ncbi:MAG TPA: DUF4383 domain-containing protein [Steroidobacteraceae bacterium]|nr:DUF4383 domain-containing protein [Steroidobacteraceae bacterium]
MLKTAAILFGVVFLVVGVLGFVPGITTDQMLLGIFHVNGAHNVVHVLSGAIALWTGRTSAAYARVYFRVFGVVYALVALLGFYVGNGMLLGLISNNVPDTWLHVAIAVVALTLGFAAKDDGSMAKAGP